MSEIKNDIHIEGDYSSASYFMVLGIFTGNILIKISKTACSLIVE
ncbi:hypothetical protein [Acidiplasma cupricumulans]|nr:hypothetical protein [Acidiplasma cupricumulans]